MLETHSYSFTSLALPVKHTIPIRLTPLLSHHSAPSPRALALPCIVVQELLQYVEDFVKEAWTACDGSGALRFGFLYSWHVELELQRG